MASTQTIDYLFEDPVIDSQKFALVSIVGPHMKQQCDVWGMKVRGVSSTIEESKSMVSRLMQVDDKYDIFIVEVGKFFPLAVNPLDVGSVEYQNEQLNEMMKGYIESREKSNLEWEERKNRMVKAAMEEGQNQEELANRPEHPVAVYQRMQQLKEQEQNFENALAEIRSNLEKSINTYESYSEEERTEAERIVSESTATSSLETEEITYDTEELRKQIQKEFDISPKSSSNPFDALTRNVPKIKEL